MTHFLFIVMFMVFFHIVDDFYFQKGLLADMKQKSWWNRKINEFDRKEDSKKNFHKMYQYDYMCALIVHAFSWAFMILLPAFIFNIYTFVNNAKLLSLYVVLVIVNAGIHAFIDNLKANRKEINLCQDQLFHLTQIVVTAFVLCSVI